MVEARRGIFVTKRQELGELSPRVLMDELRRARDTLLDLGININPSSIIEQAVAVAKRESRDRHTTMDCFDVIAESFPYVRDSQYSNFRQVINAVHTIRLVSDSNLREGIGDTIIRWGKAEL